jgi:hypothetical protein
MKCLTPPWENLSQIKQKQIGIQPETTGLFIYQRMTQKLHCGSQFDLKRFHGCDSACFF